MTDKKTSVLNRTFLPRISPFRFVLWFFRWRNIQRILFVLACIATLIAIFYAEENWRGHRAWEKYKHEQEAKGEKLDWQAFVPPSIPDDQNFAMADFWEGVRHTLDWELQRKSGQHGFIDNAEDNTRLYIYRHFLSEPGLGSWTVAKSTDMKAWQDYYRYAGPYLHRKEFVATNEFPIPVEPGEPANDVLFALGKCTPALEKLRDAATRPLSRFPLNYDGKSEMLLPHLAKIKGSFNFLLLWTAAELAAGQINEAFSDTRLMFTTADSLKTEPILISSLIRRSCLEMGISAVWEGISQHKWSEPQLKQFQEKFQSYNLSGEGANTMRGVRAEMLANLDEIAALRADSFAMPLHQASLFEIYYRDGKAAAWNELRRRSAIRFAPRGWFDLEKIEVSQSYEQVLSVINPAAHSIDIGRLAGLAPNYRRSRTLGYSADDSSRVIQTIARSQTSVNLAATACALERYCIVNGKYPEKLDDLSPAFISKVPREVTTNEPLKYRRSDDGRFVLYSLGLTNKDSGGMFLDAKGERTGNWVWRYPAK